MLRAKHAPHALRRFALLCFALAVTNMGSSFSERFVGFAGKLWLCAMPFSHSFSVRVFFLFAVIVAVCIT